MNCYFYLIFKLEMFTSRYIRALKRQYPIYSVDEIEAALILCIFSGIQEKLH